MNNAQLNQYERFYEGKQNLSDNHDSDYYSQFEVEDISKKDSFDNSDSNSCNLFETLYVKKRNQQLKKYHDTMPSDPFMTGLNDKFNKLGRLEALYVNKSNLKLKEYYKHMPSNPEVRKSMEMITRLNNDPKIRAENERRLRNRRHFIPRW